MVILYAKHIYLNKTYESVRFNFVNRLVPRGLPTLPPLLPRPLLGNEGTVDEEEDGDDVEEDEEATAEAMADASVACCCWDWSIAMDVSMLARGFPEETAAA